MQCGTMMRWVLFQLHWFLGITAGLVLAVIGVTGATMSFEDEIMAALSPGIVSVAAPFPAAAPLLPDALIARAVAQRPGRKVVSLTLSSEPLHAAQVSFDPASAGQRRGESSYIDPYRGLLLGRPNGQDFFATVRQIHRFLALPGDANGVGRTITGISTLSLIYFALSGLYLRWPRQPLNWRAWLVLDLRRTGRNLYRTLHAVIGGWVLMFYLLSGFTGLWWSYDWYRRGVTYALTGQSLQAGPSRTPRADRAAVSMPPLDAAWKGFLQASGGRFSEVMVTLPEGRGPVRFRAQLPHARFERMADEIQVATDGQVLKVDRYADRALGKVLVGGMLDLHRGSFFGWPGRVIMALTSLTMPLFAITGILLYLGRRRRKKALAQMQPLAAIEVPGDAWLIAYASQTGRAQQLARQTAIAFEATGQPVNVLSLANVGPDELGAAPRALFVASTYGDGEPPDEARTFVRRIMQQAIPLGHLEYAVLALGDREYPDFCEFGRQLDGWLHERGGRRLFERVEWDGDDVQARHRWAEMIGDLGASRHAADLSAAHFDSWRLCERRALNEGGPGAVAFHLAFEPSPAAMTSAEPLSWEPGDIVEILPRQSSQRVAACLAWMPNVDAAEAEALAERLATSDLPLVWPLELTSAGALDELVPLRPREYSVASLASSGRIELLVRQAVRDDGEYGVASGWLTRHLAADGEIAVRIRPNPGFRPPALTAPLILIGNGTGLAGLLVHLRHRHALHAAASWLLFGERSRMHDRFHQQELDGYLSAGSLARLDQIYSRESDGGYVQTLLAVHADQLTEWIKDGATILVCGSLQGMAPAVDHALRLALGDELIEQLIDTGRYRRDVY
jgi:sulfite reductase (NADPH) flavoprotein alpha-component